MVTFGLEGGFTEIQLAQIYDETLQVLEEIGVEVADDEIRDYLGSLPGITIKGDRVCYTRPLVEEWIAVIKQDNLEYSYNRKDERIRMTGPYMGQYYYDAETDDYRLATLEDLRFSVELLDAYECYGPSPIHLQTVPAPIRQVTTFKTCIENSREIGGWAPVASEKDAEWMCRLGEAAGRPAPHCCMEIPISPLRLNVEALRMIFHRRGRADQLTNMVVGGGAVPMPGATAPITVPACYVQGMAEALAAYITPQLIDPRIPGYCSFGGFLFNLRSADTTSLFPETALYELLTSQVIRYFLGETMGASIKLAGFDSVQIALRTGFEIALDLLNGARTFLGIGWYDDGFSAAGAVIAADLVQHFARFTAGREFRATPGAILQTIQEGVDAGDYLIHPTTLQFRELYLIPELVYKYDDRAELIAAVGARAQQMVAAHDYTLPDDVQHNVDEVYEASCSDLMAED